MARPPHERRLPSRARMKLAVDLLQPSLIDMGVNLGRREACVTEHLLDRPQIGSMAEQVRGNRVAQEMRPNLSLQSGRSFAYFPQ